MLKKIHWSVPKFVSFVILIIESLNRLLNVSYNTATDYLHHPPVRRVEDVMLLKIQ